MKRCASFSLISMCICAAMARPPDKPLVRVHGEATVSVTPDQAELDIAVITQGLNSAAASDDNTKRTGAVRTALLTHVPAQAVSMVNFSVNPNFRYPKDAVPLISGYTANNTVRVYVQDLSVLRALIAEALKAGAASINRLNFTLKSESDARARALGQAAHTASESANALAASLHLKLGQIILIEEGQPVVISPAPQIDLGRAQSQDLLPISPGEIQIRANVNVTYEATAQ